MPLSPGGAAGFLVEEFDLAGDVPAIAAEGAVGADNAVAWHNAHDGVGAHGLTNRTGGLRTMDTVGDILIGGHHADRDGKEILPHGQLEGCAIEMKAEARDFVVVLAEQLNGLAVDSDGAGTEAGLREMVFESPHGLPLHGGRHDETDTLRS